MSIKPVKRMNMSDLSVERIREYLESGELKVGQKLPTEKEFCDMLEVSRSTVREALRILQATGYVDMKPGRGAFLLRDKPPVPGEDVTRWFVEHEYEIQDFVEVRMAIEPLAARLAVKRATDKDIQEIEASRLQFEQALEKGETEILGKYDALFHKTVIDAAHNPLLIKMNYLIQEAFSEFRSTTFLVKKNAINAIAPHRNISNAIKERDPDRAEDFMVAHLQRVVEDMEVIVNNKGNGSSD